MRLCHGTSGRAAAFGGLALAIAATQACSSNSGSNLAGDGDGDGGGQAASDDASTPDHTTSDDATTGVFQHGDSGGSGLGTGVCKTGVYSGTFSCSFMYDADASGVSDAAGGGGGLGTITGTISFSLAQSISGELGQDTASGTIHIDAGLGVVGDATLGGTLDCNTGAFTGELANGHFGWITINPDTMFMGPLTSDYSGKTSAFVNGHWSMTIPGYGYCPGPWMASYAGPGDAG